MELGALLMELGVSPVTLEWNTMVSSDKTKVRDGIARLNYRQGTPTSEASDAETGTGRAEAESLIAKAQSTKATHPKLTQGTFQRGFLGGRFRVGSLFGRGDFLTRRVLERERFFLFCPNFCLFPKEETSLNQL